jgi:hypothetical protein
MLAGSGPPRKPALPFMTRSFAALLLMTAAAMAAILLLDGAGLPRQLLLGAATAILLWFLLRRTDVPVAETLTAISIACAGEVALTIGWGLYSYRYARIPLYVPPGHGVFYLLAAATAQQELVRRHSRLLIGLTIAGGTALTALSLFANDDVWGTLWWGGFLCLFASSRRKPMLSVCFLYTMLLEVGGTAHGNWHWAPLVPYLGIPSANPPAGVGILYAAVDLAAVALQRSRLFAFLKSPATTEDRGIATI